jgi:hypothetical protein
MELQDAQQAGHHQHHSSHLSKGRNNYSCFMQHPERNYRTATVQHPEPNCYDTRQKFLVCHLETLAGSDELHTNPNHESLSSAYRKSIQLSHRSHFMVDIESKIKCFLDVFYNRYNTRERMSLDGNNSIHEQESLMSYKTNASKLSDANDVAVSQVIGSVNIENNVPANAVEKVELSSH